ncbi:hypothetical protein [Nonomuraea africana]
MGEILAFEEKRLGEVLGAKLVASGSPLMTAMMALESMISIPSTS